MKTNRFSLSIFLILAVILLVISGSMGSASAGPLETANVMAPLRVKDWGAFEQQLNTVQRYGVDAVSVDVWWGEAEGESDNRFKWDYYDKIFAKIKAHGLKIVPILSFHQCGGNVGDECDIKLPSWLWSKYQGRSFNGIQLDADDLKYKSEQGHFSPETIQLWADALVAEEYKDFVNAFKVHFAAYAGDVIEINVSLGPSGELRYPSYNSHDSGSGYPTRGALQAYSRLAVQDFRQKMLDKYGSLSGLNQAWGINLTHASEIRPPDNADYFFRHGDYRNIRYGKDFVDWYNQSLVDHGKAMLSIAIDTLGNGFPSAKIGYKIPGVHWAMGNPSYPHAAEVAAGLIQTSVDFNADDTGHGYRKVVGLAKAFQNKGRDIVLHFTCLEMSNEDTAPEYSQAKALVFWVAQEAQRQGVAIKGENALASGVTNDYGWDNIDNAFKFAAYSGLTTLRMGEVASGIGQARYTSLINRYRGTGAGFPSLYIRGTQNQWGATPMVKIGSAWSLDNVVFGGTDNERFKFDVYGDWKKNYGGSGLQGVAVRNGKDIRVEANATYKIRFDEGQKSYVAKRVEGPQPFHSKLGVDYSRDSTTFALWSPDSSDVKLWLNGHLYPMTKNPDANGLNDVYAVTVPGDHHLKRYNFRVAGRIARDPYGVMVEPATDFNIVVDLSKTEPPEGWAARPPLKNREAAVIYEVHVRDFTIDDSSGVDTDKRGKFLGLVQSGSRYEGLTTGIDHLKELGVTHVQILPFYDYRACAKNKPDCYSWGYDPLNFNVPEENYSVSLDPIARIRELKTMINEFHKAGIRVVMDVVYNHTAEPDESTFTPISKQYFTGTDLSGTGNAIDAGKPMVGRFIRDSLEFWTREYHIDGFRFDLIGVFDYEAVADWGRYLNTKFPDVNLLIYGEPWNGYAADPKEPQRVRLGTVGKIVDAHVGAFNPKYREALKGKNDSGEGGGYIFNQLDDSFAIKVGSRGAIRFRYTPNEVLPDLWDQMFANDPEQSINYVSAHDNLILRDKILAWAKLNNVSDQGYLKRIQEFSDGVILTSQGIPFIQAGDEMLRDKQGDHNSYVSPDHINKIRWHWKKDHIDVFNYFRQAIALRRQHPALRMTTWQKINDNIQTDQPRYGVVVNRINGQAVGDDWKEVLVIYNSASNYDYSLPAGTWKVAMEKSDPAAGDEREVSGMVTAEGTAVTVLHR
ncbi:MAG: family 14 glycosylhydrolase [Gammaproteobacteria bacterium]